MFRTIALVAFLSLHVWSAVAQKSISVTQSQFQIPVLVAKKQNPIVRLKVEVPAGSSTSLMELTVDLSGTTRLTDITSIEIIYNGADSVITRGPQHVFGSAQGGRNKVNISGNLQLDAGTHYLWASYTLAEDTDLLGRIGGAFERVSLDGQSLAPKWVGQPVLLRPGVAVRQHMQEGVHTSRIPGLATTNKGTLLAIFDARYESARDLQGHMDIGLHRSEDGGNTWEPMQVTMDMGEWGGLPEKFNGVSDACILVDKNSDAIYIAGLWMYGVINEHGVWVEGLDENSEEWNHQWRTKGSQPGFGVRETSQFLIVKSTDDGKTWSDPVNITEMCKREEWWLFAPGPGQGITMEDGTLVFPTQGRDEYGEAFSNITYSKDGGETWHTSNQALDIDKGTTECAVVQLSDGALMLNMRANKNRGNTGADNGRAIAITYDMGSTWEEHPSSFGALPEPVCMASLHKHEFTHDGKHAAVLLFSNPNSKTHRDHLTIKTSFNDGMTWPANHQLLLDEGRGRGYSCITSLGEDHIGILYESSQADMVYQKIALQELLN